MVTWQIFAALCRGIVSELLLTDFLVLRDFRDCVALIGNWNSPCTVPVCVSEIFIYKGKNISFYCFWR